MSRKKQAQEILPAETGTSELQERQAKLIELRSNAKEMLGREYDYEEQKAELKATWAEVKVHTFRAGKKMIEAGKRLFVMQECEGPHWKQKIGDVANFCGANETQMYRSVQLYREFGDMDDSALDKLLDAGSSKMIEVLRLPEEIREEVREHGTLGGDDIARKSVREIRNLARKYREENKALKDQAVEGRETVAKLRAELEEVKSGKRVAPDIEFIRTIKEIQEQIYGIGSELVDQAHNDMSMEALQTCCTFFAWAHNFMTQLEVSLSLRNETYHLYAPEIVNVETGTGTELHEDEKASREALSRHIQEAEAKAAAGE